MSTLGYNLEWYDDRSESVQHMFLKVYLEDNTIELLHSQRKSAFLSRIYYPDVSLSDLFIGNSITIYNRLLVIKSYANAATTKYMESREVHFLCVVQSSKLALLGQLLALAERHEMRIGRVKSTGSSFSNDVVEVYPGDMVLELVGLLGVDQRSFLREVDTLIPSGGVIVSPCDIQMLSRILQSCTPVPIPSSCTLCLIKPHVLKERNVASVLNEITREGFCFKAMYSVHLSVFMAEPFFSVYRGLYPKYLAMVDQICSGPLLAVMIGGSSDDTGLVTRFRALCGPLEPDVAKALRPRSLRALFSGSDSVFNAVHCTDLSEDGELECSYFFQTLTII